MLVSLQDASLDKETYKSFLALKIKTIYHLSANKTPLGNREQSLISSNVIAEARDEYEQAERQQPTN